MKLVVFSTSPPFEHFLRAHLDTEFDFRRDFAMPGSDPDRVYLLHRHNEESGVYDWLKRYASTNPVKVAVCADVPEIREMLACVRLGARAYCNSHMGAIHYSQMLRLLSQGQSWFPPRMLEETFALAQQAIEPQGPQNPIDMLTPREQEVAFAVGAGKTNRQVAAQLKISEPTVKTHLTNIFQKLGVRDRVSLVLYLKPN